AVGNPDWPVQLGHQRLRILHFGLAQSTLDLADRIEVLRDTTTIAGRQRAAELGELRGNRVEDAAILADLGVARGGARSVAEQSLENISRIVFHRQWRRRRPPRNRVR